MRDYYEVEWIFPTVMHRFETRELPIPDDYHGLLTFFYGDYMTPPPKEQQRDHHLKAWWLTEESLDEALPEAWNEEPLNEAK